MSSVVASFEQRLGDPRLPELPLSFARTIDADERDEFPTEAIELLDRLGLYRHYVPVEHGGELSDFTVLSGLIRAVARRDLTTAIAHGKTFLGASPVWVGGSKEIRERLARIILAARPVALGLTERESGSDLLSMRTTAREEGGAYRLDGEKWLINNGSRCEAMTVFSRTRAEGGPRGFSLLLVNKTELAEGTFSAVPRVRTHGIRGADISGLRFEGARVPFDARVGADGAGLEIILKALQVTRSLLPALSLGAADTGLRLVLDFARSRSIYGGTVVDIPHARRALAESFLDLLICEALATTAARALHAAPEQVSKMSSVVKYLVPTLVDRLLGRLSVIFGARFYLREGHGAGMFQKIIRDHSIVGLFDGSTVVNLTALALQLPRLAGLRAGKAELARSRAWFDLGTTPPPADLSRLSLVIRDRDEILQSLPDALTTLESMSGPTTVCDRLRSLTGDLLRELSSEVRSPPPGGSPQRLPAAWFDLAERHTTLHAAATCLLLWLHNREHGDAFFREGAWTALAMGRLLSSTPLSGADTDLVMARLQDLAESNSVLGLNPMPLAPLKE